MLLIYNQQQNIIMPNWCGNEIIIKGDKSSINKLKGDLRTDKEKLEMSFQRTIPRPDKEDEDWYDWNVKNWGTKWDADGYLDENSDETLSGCFSTAWSPPCEWARQVAIKYNIEVIIKYREPGMEFSGTITATKDEYLDQEDEFIASEEEW